MYTAVGLDPETKLQYFQSQWKDHPEWIATAERSASPLAKSGYRTATYSDILIPETTIFNSSLPIPVSSRSKNKVSFTGWKRNKRARLNTTDGNQCDKFQFTEEEEDVLDMVGYWADRLFNPGWSQLGHMTCEIHSIPAMSAKVEHVLSRSDNFPFYLRVQL